MIEIYNDYDAFAFFYNKYWTRNVPALMEKALDVLLFDRIPDKSSILDLCCGSGNNALMMKSKGYRVKGLDGSGALLAYAASKAPGVDFIRADARNFDLGEKFGAVTCLFDSVNHLTKKEDLIKVFRNVFYHLEEGGLFIFDANSKKSSEEAGDGGFAAVEDESVFISSPFYDKNTRITDFALTMFLREGNRWIRNDAHIYELYHRPEELFSALKAAGFKNFSLCDGGVDLRIEGFEGRMFVSAWK